MPIAAPVLAALITAGTAGTEIGLQASGAFQPSTSGALKQQEQLDAEAKQKAQQEQSQALFRRVAPDAQSQTGGSLSDQSLAAMIAELAGQPGGVTEAQQTIFGNTGPGLSSSNVGGQ